MKDQNSVTDVFVHLNDLLDGGGLHEDRSDAFLNGQHHTFRSLDADRRRSQFDGLDGILNLPKKHNQTISSSI